MAHGDRQTVLMEGVYSRDLVMSFDTESLTSDGGMTLVAAADRALGLTEALGGAILDRRQGGKIAHDSAGLLRQRILGLVAGYADCNDSSRLGDDPLWRRLKGDRRGEAMPLASQPTLSRFENRVTSRDLVRMGRVLRDTVIARARQRYGKEPVRRILIDLDPTCDPAHGRQQLIEFNAYYGTWCYLPMCAFLTFDGHPENHLVAALLRSGECRDFDGAIALLRRLVPALREAFPKTQLVVRLDAGFGNDEILTWLEEQGLQYVVSLSRTRTLEDTVELFDLMQAARQAAFATGESARGFGEIEHLAHAWDMPRRVIIKGEVVCLEGREARDNPRFVATNMRGKPEDLYALYVGRGEIENRIKELKHGLQLDRTSCPRFFANQLRVLLTAAAYVLMQELRLAAAGTSCERAQVDTLRIRLLKIGARVVESVRRLVLHGPLAYPWLDDFRVIARRLVAHL